MEPDEFLHFHRISETKYFGFSQELLRMVYSTNFS